MIIKYFIYVCNKFNCKYKIKFTFAKSNKEKLLNEKYLLLNILGIKYKKKA
jgi:hypothetical protein